MVKYQLPTNESYANVTGMRSLFGYVQKVSEGWFFLMILFAIFIIVFISLKQYSNSKAFASASFLCMILSIIMRTLEFISSTWMYLFIILVAVSVVWLHIDSSQS